ncbi:dTDP-6-deoxy-L-hexose 3-O-methyltransferase [Escherichia coli]|uniref:dTDP-6-deoxy-L-hexose 3-O-methyltransferase n=1 Tax=Escherichia coli TaxID=562 RepID=UPI0032E47BD7
MALAALEVEPIGFRCRRNDNLGDWSYVYHREPDDFERKHLVIEGIYAAPPVPVVPEEKPMPNPLKMYAVDAVAAIAEVRGRNACRAAMLQSGNFREISETSTNSPITLTPLPGGFTIEDAKELHEDLVRSHISQALSGEKMKKKDRDADLLWIHGVIVQAAWFVKASLDALPEPLREEKGGSPTEESEAGL